MNLSNRPEHMRSGYISQNLLLGMVQQQEQFVYALITREGAVKIGVSVHLMNRKKTIRFGGVRQFVGFRPGGYPEERAIHAQLTEHRIFGTKEYYYPNPGMLVPINEMREFMGIRPLRRKDLPRLSQCTFHARVLQQQSAAQGPTLNLSA